MPSNPSSGNLSRQAMEETSIWKLLSDINLVHFTNTYVLTPGGGGPEVKCIAAAHILPAVVEACVWQRCGGGREYKGQHRSFPFITNKVKSYSFFKCRLSSHLFPEIFQRFPSSFFPLLESSITCIFSPYLTLK